MRVVTQQQTILELVSQRFPTLQRLAKTQVRTIKQPELLQQAMLRLSLTRDTDEVQDVLFSLTENEEDK